MRIDILTLFPETLGDVLSDSILGRAQEREIIRIETHQIRDYTQNKQFQVDDYPYGGGRGAIMQADPLFRCWESVKEQTDGPVHTIYMSPCGRVFKQEDAIRLSKMDNLILVCGHYEGIDQRFIDECVDEEISLGDFVLTGGEIAAMAVTDAVCRMVPGVLADPLCFEDESHYNGMLEYPQYSRPAVWHERAVPDVLLSGNHVEVDKWRRKQSLIRTKERRPDMYEKLDLNNKSDKKLLKEIENDKFLQRVSVRKAGPGDEEALAEIQIMSWQNAFRDILTEEILCESTELQTTINMYKRVLQENKIEIWMLSLDEKPVMLAAWGESRTSDCQEYAELIAIHGKPEIWRKGLGSYLLKTVRAQMKDRGYRKMMLWVFEKNTRARKFYQHHGMNVTDQKHDFRGANEIMYLGKV